MTPDQIIAWAKEANLLEAIDLLPTNPWREDTLRELTRFANLVARHQKERDAKLCDVAEFNGRSAAYCATAIWNQKEA